MFLHISFDDGSKPFTKYGIKDKKALETLLKRWSNSYTLKALGMTKNGGAFFKATKKE